MEYYHFDHLHHDNVRPSVTEINDELAFAYFALSPLKEDQDDQKRRMVIIPKVKLTLIF
jgi:hypothetical protein